MFSISATVRLNTEVLSISGLFPYSRRKAEEDRMRKEEEKARRELIKQEYLRRKQQEIFEEQEQPKQPKPKPKPKKQRPKSVLKEESSNGTLPRSHAASKLLICFVFYFDDLMFGYHHCFFVGVKLCSSPDDNLISAQSGSNLSLASVATTEPDSVNSGGAGSQR